MRKIIELLRNFNELVMFQHTIFSLPFIFIAMIISANGWFGWKLTLLAIVAGISARNFAMAFNRLVDINHDSKNARTLNRPSVDGRLSKLQISIFTFLNGFIFIIIAKYINDLAFILAIPMLIVIASYSYFKRFSYFAHIVLGISLSFAPIAGVVAIENMIPFWTILLSLGVMFWVAGFDLLYSLQDLEFDKKFGLHSIPAKFGKNRTLKISAIFHLLTIIFWTASIFYANLGLIAKTIPIISALMLSYEHIIVRRDFNKINRAFFTINGYLGIIFLMLIILDNLFKI
jgi:4-hydroxybenzoate polyprenyltransferase